jgi:hypothetical protein
MVDKAYTQIPMEKLDFIRRELNSKLRKLEFSTGEKYSIRTFYLGPRGYRDRNTLKSRATAAKIGIYTVTGKRKAWGGYGSQYYTNTVLDRYL